MSRERPILFNGDMVRAILEGRKTMTRRVMKHQPGEVTAVGRPLFFQDGDTGRRVSPKCPYGQPGDRLWVRETWMNLKGTGVSGSPDPKFNPKQIPVAYRAECTAEGEDARIDMGLKWRPSIYMPRWASRINLEITGVRVERLQGISEEDAKAEGIEPVGGPASVSPWRNYRIGKDGEMSLHCSAPSRSFMTLWESINGPGSWDANPWVWVVEFRRLP